jgi:hypothetical protein
MTFQVIQYNKYQEISKWLFISIGIVIIICSLCDRLITCAPLICGIVLVITILLFFLNLVFNQNYDNLGLVSLTTTYFHINHDSNETLIFNRDILEVQFIYGGYRGMTYIPDIFSKGKRDKDGCENYLLVRSEQKAEKIQILVGSENEFNELLHFLKLLSDEGISAIFINNICGLKLLQRKKRLSNNIKNNV